VASALSTDLQGGGGSGSVKNITYDTMTIQNVDYAIEVTQCYGQKNLTLCNEYPVRHISGFLTVYCLYGNANLWFPIIQSSMTISDVHFKNIKGTTSGKYDPLVGTIVCSSPNVSCILFLDGSCDISNSTRFARIFTPLRLRLRVLRDTMHSLALM
jgi:galacturan 1,4-alpha-galacturonidase